MFFNRCDKCPTVEIQRTTIKSLEEKLSKMKEHYREDIKVLNRQICLERDEYEKSNFTIKDVDSRRNMIDPYEFETFTRYECPTQKERVSRRPTFYQNYFKI